MFCHKCGTEITSEDASFCSGCGEPLANDQSASEGRSPDSAFPDLNQESTPDNVNLKFGDDEEPLKMSDPIDFLMEENEEEETPPDPPVNKGTTNKFSALDSEAMKKLMGDAGSGMSSADEPEGRQYGGTAVDTMVETQKTSQPADQQPETDGDTDGPQSENQHDEQQQTDSDSHTGTDMTDQHSGTDSETAGTESEIPGDEKQYSETENLPEDQNLGINSEKMQADQQTQEPQEYQIQDEQPRAETDNVGQAAESDTGNSQTDQNHQDYPDVQSQAEQTQQEIGTAGQAAETNMENTPTTPENQEQNTPSAPAEVNVNQNAENDKQQMPPPLEVSPQDDFTRGENVVPTSKIKVEDKTRNATDKTNTRDLKLNSEISMFNRPKPTMDKGNLDISKIKRSSMIAYLSGNNLSFTGGPKISAGDEIKVGDSSYEVRLRPKDKNNLYMLIGSVVLSILVTFYFLGAFSSSDYGGLVGTVVDSSNRPLSGQKVRIKQTGDKYTTNSAGFFIFDDIPVGIYTIEYLLDDEVVAEEGITVLGGKISTVKISSSGIRPISSLNSGPAKGRTGAPVKKKRNQPT